VAASEALPKEVIALGRLLQFRQRSVDEDDDSEIGLFLSGLISALGVGTLRCTACGSSLTEKTDSDEGVPPQEP
jgi:hypothetical protein